MTFLISPTISSELLDALANMDILNEPEDSLSRFGSSDVFQIPWRSEFLDVVNRVMAEAVCS
jgi:hypothetical protein